MEGKTVLFPKVENRETDDEPMPICLRVFVTFLVLIDAVMVCFIFWGIFLQVTGQMDLD